MNRRQFMERLLVITAMSAAGVAGVVGVIELINSKQPQSSISLLTLPTTTTETQVNSQTGSGTAQNGTQTTQATSSVPGGYILVAPLSALAGKSSAYFNHPTLGTCILINYNGSWLAFSATCTHQNCTVNFKNSNTLFCPCHNGSFDPTNGNVTGGPPPRSLPEYGVMILNNNLYVGNSQIN